MGDTVTRLDRYEPDLGLVLSADLRDTTSPMAMAHLVRRITTGDHLQSGSRERLLHGCRTPTPAPIDCVPISPPVAFREQNRNRTH